MSMRRYFALLAFLSLFVPTVIKASPDDGVESSLILEATRKAINTYCATSYLETAAQQKTCGDAISTLVKSFAAEYAMQFERGSVIANENENFGIFANYNLKKNCLETDKSLTSSLQCIRAIYALESETTVNGALPETGKPFSYDRSDTRTVFDRPLFDTIAMGTICSYGLANRAVPEMKICAAQAKQYGLDF